MPAKRGHLAGDFWGGLSAMLVALPSAIAFGVTIFSPLGGSYAAQGALAGILGATALGLVAPTFGGTHRLVSAPCAPAAAVLAAFAIDLSQRGFAAEGVVLRIALVALICGLVQMSFGFLGLGRLIKYMPFPVVSGYLSGVGLIIIVGQIPKLLGTPKQLTLVEALASSQHWQWPGIAVGLVTMSVMLVGAKITRAIPPAILGLLAGALTYAVAGLLDSTLFTLSGNALVIGPLGGSGAGFIDASIGRWRPATALGLSDLQLLFVPAATLAVLLSIDTLKTCVVLDALTRSRHDSNRELIGQGLGNIASTLVGGVPGAGTMGATLVNISSGAQTRASGLVEGVLALLAFLVLGNVIAWVPIGALAGILIVVGFRMIDRHSAQLLKSRSTVLDFVVIAAVIVTALTWSLIAASGVGIALAVMLFIREQIRGSVVRRRTTGGNMFSKQVRLPEEVALLEKRGTQTAIYELQGSLFFGTTHQLFAALDDDLKACRYVVLDLRRVQSVDVTAAHMLDLVEDTLAEREAFLIFSHLPRNVPSGRDMQQYFDQLGLARHRFVRVFGELDEALEWVENRILDEERLGRAQEAPIELRELPLFAGRKEDTLAALEECLERRCHAAGEKIFAQGDTGDELFFVRRGAVRIVLPLAGSHAHHLATFGRGNFFGEMAFLDRQVRSADALAHTDTELFVLSRARFDSLVENHRKLGICVFEGLAMALALRLRHSNTELRALQDN